MGFSKLIDKVSQAEQRLEARERDVGASWRQLKGTWRQAWTPGRIVVAGIASGFLVGRAQPLSGMCGSGVLQMMTTLSGFIATTAAPFAMDDADMGDAETSEGGDTADTAGDATPATTRDALQDHEAWRREGLL